jgi:DNA-directed RNA polymerase subunit RPC12/RpoP
MGMFDTVIIKCPNCGGDYEEQIKSGPCLLKVYNFENAPNYLKYGVVGDYTCYHCKSEFQVREKTKPTFEVRLLTQDEIDKENYRDE